jgi:uncharacterized delta-60 repeat protein
MKNSLSRRAFAIVGLSIAWFVTIACATPGLPGTLDPTWAASGGTPGAGRLLTSVGPSIDIAYAMAVQVDGKIVMAGECNSQSRNAFCALRYNTDGTLDTSFNGSGTVLTLLGDSSASAKAVAIQPDGKIVLAGVCFSGGGFRFCALRYNADGSVDGGFGTGGSVITAVAPIFSHAYAIAIQSDGKIVLAGACATSTFGINDFCVARYNVNGTPDNGFNGSGKVVTPMNANTTSHAKAMAIQADGKIVLAGGCAPANSRSYACAARYNVDGTLDVEFVAFPSSPTPGRVFLPLDTAAANAVAIQADGRIVFVASCTVGVNSQFCAARVNANGDIDNRFGDRGIATTYFRGLDFATSIALQTDGKIVIAGNCSDGTDRDFCALRYHMSGVLDSEFNDIGLVTTAIGGGNDQANAVAIQTDGKIVLAGNCANGVDAFCTARYDGGPFGARNCKLDIDGDNRVSRQTDSLILARVAAGITGNAVVAGISFSASATRTTWPTIRAFLVSQCGMNLPL